MTVNSDAPYVTTVRPPTEPYEIWAERRRLQKKALKKYLRGRPFWRSNVLAPVYQKGTKLVIVDVKKVKLQGTYVAPVCPLCAKKEKKCKCIKLIS